MKIQSDSVDLTWSKSEEKVENYQIRYKSKDSNEKWKSVETDADQNQITIAGLKANTKYVFKVRGAFHDQEGQYGPENDDVQTIMPLASHLLQSAKPVADGSPAKYQLSV